MVSPSHMFTFTKQGKDRRKCRRHWFSTLVLRFLLPRRGGTGGIAICGLDFMMIFGKKYSRLNRELKIVSCKITLLYSINSTYLLRRHDPPLLAYFSGKHTLSCLPQIELQNSSPSMNLLHLCGFFEKKRHVVLNPRS